MSRHARVKLRLYVAGDAQNSTQAVTNLNALCHTYLVDRHDVPDLIRRLDPDG